MIALLMKYYSRINNIGRPSDMTTYSEFCIDEMDVNEMYSDERYHDM